MELRSNDLEKQIEEIIEASTDTDEAAQVGRGILHVQFADGPLSLALKEVIGKFARVLVKNAYMAGFSAGQAAAELGRPPAAPAKRGWLKRPFGKPS